VVTLDELDLPLTPLGRDLGWQHPVGCDPVVTELGQHPTCVVHELVHAAMGPHARHLDDRMRPDVDPKLVEKGRRNPAFVVDAEGNPKLLTLVRGDRQLEVPPRVVASRASTQGDAH